MEQLKEKVINTSINEYHSSDLPQNRILFNLKNHNIVQQSLINAFLIRYNCLIENLASILNIDEKKLNLVWQGKDTLSEKDAFDLVHLFYGLFR